MMHLLKAVSAAALIFAIGIGCDSGGPTEPLPEPEPGPITLTLTANPAMIEPEKTSEVTVTGVQDQAPLAGATVVLSTDIGSLSATTVTLDAAGTASVTFTAPSSSGTATVSAQSDAATASVEIEVVAVEGVAVAPDSVELEHSRSGSRCPDPISPILEVSNIGTEALDFLVVDDLPVWLTVDFFTGSVPGTLQAIYTCEVAEGDLDLAHTLRIQGVDPTTSEAIGEEALVEITVRVRS